jgi:hypothetical protein
MITKATKNRIFVKRAIMNPQKSYRLESVWTKDRLFILAAGTKLEDGISTQRRNQHEQNRNPGIRRFTLSLLIGSVQRNFNGAGARDSRKTQPAACR